MYYDVVTVVSSLAWAAIIALVVGRAFRNKYRKLTKRSHTALMFEISKFTSAHVTALFGPGVFADHDDDVTPDGEAAGANQTPEAEEDQVWRPRWLEQLFEAETKASTETTQTIFPVKSRRGQREKRSEN